MSRRTWKESSVSLPAVGVSLLPKVICPMCSPVYAALLSALGLGFLISTYLLPLTMIVLSLAVGSLFVRASRRRGLGPLWTGMAAAGCILFGKFFLDSMTLTYAGVGVLVAASVWNAVPRRPIVDFCPACLPTEATQRREGNRGNRPWDTPLKSSAPAARPAQTRSRW